MEHEARLKEANDEVMRKIGRNMVMFQQVESLLKFILAYGSISGSASNLKAKTERRIADIKGKTMGQLVGAFIDTTYSDEKRSSSPEPVDKVHISFSFRIECEDDHYESQKRVFAELVAERNELIHHLLPRYNPESLESCQELAHHLEQQCDKLLPELNNLKTMAQIFKKAVQEQLSFMDSEDGYRLLIEGLLPGESRLDGLLKKVASLAARADGWAPLAAAGKLIREQDPDTISKVCEEHGVKRLNNLKNLIEASPAFELTKEPTKGGIQWLYRLKAFPHEDQESTM